MPCSPAPRFVLIAGSSHTGKSTLAARLAASLGLERNSTDRLARHPGRPWGPPGYEVPSHVAAHYTENDTPALITSVLAHYAALQPLIRHTLEHAERGLVLEGSALLPKRLRALSTAAAVCLVAPDAFLRDRILSSCGYANRMRDERRLIDAFIARSLAFNRLVADEALEAGVHLLDVSDCASPEALEAECLALIRLPAPQ